MRFHNLPFESLCAGVSREAKGLRVPFDSVTEFAGLYDHSFQRNSQESGFPMTAKPDQTEVVHFYSDFLGIICITNCLPP